MQGVQGSLGVFAWLIGQKSISPDGLHRLVQGAGPISVIDVNSRQSWEKAHVQGARNFDPAGY